MLSSPLSLVNALLSSNLFIFYFFQSSFYFHLHYQSILSSRCRLPAPSVDLGIVSNAPALSALLVMSTGTPAPALKTESDLFPFFFSFS